MKKIVFALLILLVSAGFLAAEASESPYYVRTVAIAKVFSHEDGYKVIYRNSKMQYSSFYVPVEWFGGASSKAEIIYGESQSYPYFSIFWKDGAFDHIRLYLKSDRRDLTWGDLDSNTDWSSKFDGVETIELKL